MLIRYMKKLIPITVAILLTAAAIPSVAPFAVSAEAAPSTVSEPDARVMKEAIDVMEDDFNRATVDWTVKSGTAEAVTALSSAPYAAFEGSRSLLLTADGNTVSLSRKPEKLGELSRVRFLMAAVYAPADGGSVTVTATVRDQGKTYTRTEALIPGRWQAVVFDLTDAKLSGRATELRLTFTASEKGKTFLLDTLGGGTETTDAFTVRHLAPTYRGEGCSFQVTPSGSMEVLVTGGGQYIEAESPALTDFSGGVGIRVRLNNRSNCRSLTLRYTTLSAPEYTEKRSETVAIPEGEGVVSCLFPIPESYVGRFRVEFDGLCFGEIEILSVTAAPCYTGAPTVGTVSECLIGKSRDTVTVKGSIGAENVTKYADCTLYLYELAPWEELSAVSTARPAVAETTLNGAEFSFTVALSEGREELYRKYAVMVYYAGALVPVGSPRFINNPEALAADTAGRALSSIKGYWPLTGDYLFDGVSCTTVEIRLDKFVSLGEGAMTHRVGNASCSFDTAYVEALDKQMQEYRACGVKVYLFLRLALSDDLSRNDLLCHPRAAGGQYAAFNTVSENGIGALRAVCDFLANRYGTPGGKSDNLMGFAVGSSVNDAATHYAMGDADLVGLAKAYGNALRVVYNAARSVSSAIEVYMPLGGSWYGAVTTSGTSSFDARSVLEAVSAYLKAGGDIDWDLSYDISSQKDGYPWEIDTPDLSSEAAAVTAVNLEVLTSYLATEPLSYKGSSRGILLLETEPREAEDENERIRMSADYVYTYLRLASRAFASVRAWIPAHPVNYNQVLTYIDTNRFSEVTAFAAELIGAERFNALLPDAASVVNRYVNEVKAVTTVPSAVKGETRIFDFSDGTAGWYGALNCASLKGGTTLEGRSDLLSVRLASADAALWRGIATEFEQPLDFSPAPYLGFTCRPAVLPEGVETLELAVVVTAGSNLQIATLTVTAGVDTTVVVDLTSFPGKAACDGMAIYAKCVDGVDLGEPTLLIGSIRAMSDRLGGAELDQAIRTDHAEEDRPTVTLTTVVTVAAVGLLALVAEGIRMILRKKAEETQD